MAVENIYSEFSTNLNIKTFGDISELLKIEFNNIKPSEEINLIGQDQCEIKECTIYPEKLCEDLEINHKRFGIEIFANYLPNEKYNTEHYIKRNYDIVDLTEDGHEYDNYIFSNNIEPLYPDQLSTDTKNSLLQYGIQLYNPLEGSNMDLFRKQSSEVPPFIPDCRPHIYYQNYRLPTSQDCRPPKKQNYGPPSNQDCRPPSNQDCRPPSNQDCRPPSNQDDRPPSTHDYRPPSTHDYIPTLIQESIRDLRQKSNDFEQTRFNHDSKKSSKQDSRKRLRPPANNDSRQPLKQGSRKRLSLDLKLQTNNDSRLTLKQGSRMSTNQVFRPKLTSYKDFINNKNKFQDSVNDFIYNKKKFQDSDLTIKTKTLKVSPLSTNNSKDSTNIYCKNCNQIFHQSSLNKHLYHCKYLEMRCVECQKQFKSKGKLISHIRQCHSYTKNTVRECASI